MAKQQVVTVSRRELKGSNASRRLRQSGTVPAVLYGDAREPVTISIEERALKRILHSESGENTIFELALEGTDKTRAAMIKDFQVHPVTDRLLHADFIRIKPDQELTVNVPVEVLGTAYGVKTEGGRLDNPLRELTLACLPSDIPTKLQVDVTELHLHQIVHAGEFELPEGVRLLTDPQAAVVACHPKIVEEEPTAEVEEAAEVVEGAEGAEGEPTSPKEDESE